MQKNALKPRDLGELRSLAAELKREGCEALERDRIIDVKADSDITGNLSNDSQTHRN